MTKERNDTLDSKYKKISCFNNVKRGLFYLSLICSFIATFTVENNFKDVFLIFFIVIILSLFVVDIVLAVQLIPKTENIRKTHLISNSFGISLNDEKTKGYYNNNSVPSIFRLGLNVFENSLFSFEVSKKMLRKVRCKSIILVVLTFIRTTQMEVILFIVQLLFSTNIIANWIKLEIYKNGTEKIYQKCRDIYLLNTKEQELTNGNLSKILDITIEYESLKARMGVMLSTKIFNEINPRVSKEWEEIKRELKLE